MQSSYRRACRPVNGEVQKFSTHDFLDPQDAGEIAQVRGKNPMNLKEWVASQGGCAEVARRLGVTRQVVYIWVTGKGTPTAKRIGELIALSKGKLDFEAITKPTRSSKKQKAGA
jgi:DNA-binding phage protein